MLLTDRPTSEPPGTEDGSLRELAAALERSVSWLRRATRPAEWSAVALSTLDALDRHGPQRVSDLVGRERISQPGMTGLVTRLEAAGLVERGSDPRDRRAALVALTENGRRYLHDVRALRSETLVDHLAALPGEQQHALRAAAPALAALAARPLAD